MDLDGMIDMGVQAIQVRLVQPDGTIVDRTDTNENGAYNFEEVYEGDYEIVLANGDRFRIIAAGDYSSDGDPSDGFITEENRIEVVLESGEIDSDNDFIVRENRGRITGQVLIDTDNDGVGDIPVENNIVLLTFRGPEGASVSNPDWPWNESVSTTDVNGVFSFGDDIPETGEFVIYNVGLADPDLICVSSEDLSPEPGEPQNQHPECIFIQCDLLTAESEDHDNVYILARQ